MFHFPGEKGSLKNSPFRLQKEIVRHLPSIDFLYPIGSMYGIFTYAWLNFMVNVGKYSIHGAYGICKLAVSFTEGF